jgi:hypothetical protein
MYVEPALQAATCPVVRQLLGESTSSAGLYLPTAEDTPLRRWLLEHGFDDNGGVGYDNLVAQQDQRAIDGGWAERGLAAPPRGERWQWQLDGDSGPSTLPRHPQRAASGRLLRNTSYRSAGDEKQVEALTGSWEVDQPFSAEEATAQARAVIDAVEMDAGEWSRQSLSDSQRERFESDGYLVLEGSVLAEEQVVELRGVLDDVIAASAAGCAGAFSAANGYSTEPALLGLLTNSAVLPKVTQLLDSTNTAVTHAILYGSVPVADVVAGGKALAAIDRDLEMRPAPMIAVEAVFNLQSQGEEAIACWCQPGSHHRLDYPPADGPARSVPVIVPRGGCVLLHRRLLRDHQASGTIALGFGPRWLRPAGPMMVEKALAIATCPVLRQMLGWVCSQAICCCLWFLGLF